MLLWDMKMIFVWDGWLQNSSVMHIYPQLDTGKRQILVKRMLKCALKSI